MHIATVSPKLWEEKQQLKRRVLAVDDDSRATRLAKLVLERTNNYEVVEVNDARSALNVAKEVKPDLILMDVDMPGMDGRTVACLIQAEKELGDVPIIFISSVMSEDSGASNNPFGWLGVLTKPVSAERLVERVNSVFRDI